MQRPGRPAFEAGPKIHVGDHRPFPVKWRAGDAITPWQQNEWPRRHALVCTRAFALVRSRLVSGHRS